MVDAIPRQARLIYVTPSHQFPLGVVLARHRRLELLRWAGRNNAAVLEDDYDSEFRHVARPLEPLRRLDRDGRVIYVGTFSKTVSPALRLGFLVAPPSLIPAICALRARARRALAAHEHARPARCRSAPPSRGVRPYRSGRR